MICLTVTTSNEPKQIILKNSLKSPFVNIFTKSLISYRPIKFIFKNTSWPSRFILGMKGEFT